MCLQRFEERFGAGGQIALAVGGAHDDMEDLRVEFGDIELAHIEDGDLVFVQLLGYCLGNFLRCAHFRTEQDDDPHRASPSAETLERQS